MMPADAWVVEDPIGCPTCGLEACENPDHLPPELDAAGSSNANTKGLRIYDDVALMNIPAPPCLIDNRIIAGSLVVLFGPTGKYKTFTKIALDLAVTTGTDWMGARVLKRGPVVACIAEGLGRYKYRIAAAKLDLGLSLAERVNLYTVYHGFSLLDLSAVRAFVAEVAPLHPVMVSFDPLIRFMAGGDEKESADISRVVDACAFIQDELQATVEIIHHTGWDQSRERGSSALRAAADTVLSQNEDDGAIVLKCEKQKDLEEFTPIRLTPLVVPAFDGFSSCVLKLAADRPTGTVNGLTVKQREAFDALKQHFPNGAAHSTWKKALPADYLDRTLYRAEQALEKAGLISREGARRPVFIPLPDI